MSKVTDTASDLDRLGFAGERVAVFLRDAALGRVDEVERALARRPALVHAVGPHPFWGGRPQALHVAIEAGRDAVFARLLAAGAEVDGRNDGYLGWSPLLLAIQRDRVAMRDELLARGARVGLAEALALGDDARVEAILAADPEAVGRPAPNGASWLAFARTPTAIDRLLELGASIDAPDTFGATPVEALSRLGERGRELLARLESRGARASAAEHARAGDRARLEEIERTDPAALRSPAVLLAAVDAGRRDLVPWLLDRGADPGARRPPTNETALHLAAWNGDLEAVRLLARRGADVHAKDDRYDATPAGWAETAIEVANRPSCRAVADYLRELESGGRPRRRLPPDGSEPAPRTTWKPIMDAAFAGDAASVERLLASGADPNVLSGTTFRHRPLHRSIESKKTLPKHRGHEEVVRLLLDHGADPLLRGGFERLTALALAAVGEPRFVPLLRERLGPLDVFHAAATLDRERVAELLAAQPALACAIDENGWPVFHLLAASAVFRTGPEAAATQLAIARDLLGHGADPNAAYLFDGKWPLPVLFQCCGRQDNPALAALLLDAGANPKDGESVCHAAENEHHGCLALFAARLDPETLAHEATAALRFLIRYRRVRGVAWCLEHGADPEAREPESGESALDLAAGRGAGERVLRMLRRAVARGYGARGAPPR